MYYYKIIPADTVDVAVRESAAIGLHIAATLLKHGSAMPLDRARTAMKWMRPCGEDEWRSSGSGLELLCRKWEYPVGGVWNAKYGIYLNADVTPDKALESGIHEWFHAYQNATNRFPKGSVTKESEKIIEKHTEEFTRQALEIVASVRKYIRANGLAPQAEPDAPMRERYTVPSANIINLQAVRYAKRHHVKLG